MMMSHAMPTGAILRSALITASITIELVCCRHVIMSEETPPFTMINQRPASAAGHHHHRQRRTTRTVPDDNPTTPTQHPTLAASATWPTTDIEIWNDDDDDRHQHRVDGADFPVVSRRPMPASKSVNWINDVGTVQLSSFIDRHRGPEVGECTMMALYGLLTGDCSSTRQNSVSAAVDRLSQQAPLDRLRVVRLDGNRLTALEAGSFGDRLARLERLLVARNLISRIDDEAFRGLDRLQLLDMNTNRLTSLPVGSFRHLSSVRVLNFANNALGSIGPEAFLLLPVLESVDLSLCQLDYVAPTAFAGCRRLVAVNLADNELVALEQSMSFHVPPCVWNDTCSRPPRPFDDGTIYAAEPQRGYLHAVPPVAKDAVVQTSTSAMLDLGGNPWRCDCQLRWLRRRLPIPDRYGSSTFDGGGGIKWPACREPEVLRGVAWRHLAPEQFACPPILIEDDDDEDDESESDDGDVNHLDHHHHHLQQQQQHQGGRRHRQRRRVIEVQRGHNASVRCIVSGDPEPRVHWTRQIVSVKLSPPSPAAPDLRRADAVVPADDGGNLRPAYVGVGHLLPVTSITTLTKRHNRAAASKNDSAAVRRKGGERRGDTRRSGGWFEWRLVSEVQLIAVSADSHDGEYRCTAVNSAGRAEMAFIVAVVDDDDDARRRSPASSSKSTTRSRSRRRLVANWTLVGRSIAVLGMAVVVVAAGLTALIVVHRHRQAASRRVRDCGATSSTMPPQPRRRTAPQRRMNEDRHRPGRDDFDDLADIASASAGDDHRKKNAKCVVAPNGMSGVRCTRPSKLSVMTVSVRSAGGTRSMMTCTSRSTTSRSTRRRSERTVQVAVAAWDRCTLTPIAEASSETDEIQQQQQQTARNEFRVKIFPVR